MYDTLPFTIKLKWVCLGPNCSTEEAQVIKSVFNEESVGTNWSKAGKVKNRMSVWKYCC